MKKVEADVAIVKNVNEKLLNQLIKTKRQMGMGKLYIFFVSNGTIKVKILENDRAKPSTHAADLKMFSDIDVDNL